MAEDTDGIEEAFEGQLRVLVTAAAQIGERIARARQDARRRAQAASEQQARELASRLAAEQRTARTTLGQVHRTDWWARATPEQIGHTYQVARAWGAEEPEAVRAEQRIKDELTTRYGVDVENTHADPEAVRTAIERAEQDRAQAEAEHNHRVAENAEAQRLMTQADHQDRRAEQARAAAEHEPKPEDRVRAAAETEQRQTTADGTRQQGRSLYDTAERRDGTARELEAQGLDGHVVATRLRADVSQGQPATEAVVGTGKTTAPKVRKATGRGPTVQRSELHR